MGVVIVQQVNFHALSEIPELNIDFIPIPLSDAKTFYISTRPIHEILALGKGDVEASYDSARSKLKSIFLDLVDFVSHVEFASLDKIHLQGLFKLLADKLFRFEKAGLKRSEYAHHEFLVMPIVPLIIRIILKLLPWEGSSLSNLPILQADFV